MKLVLALFVAICYLQLSVDAKETVCQKQVKDKTPLECTKTGKFVNKQCNADICWCVKPRSGKSAYKKLMVPLGEKYDCSRKPQRCEKERFTSLQKSNGFIPECDASGNYVEKQCTNKPAAECQVDEQPALKKEQLPSCGSTQEIVGKEIKDRPITDAARYWTMVDVDTFKKAGQVDTIELFSAAANRGLRVGIYRPTSNVACQFKLVQQIAFTSFAPGYNKVTLTGKQVLDVQAGDHFGFTWLNFGVVKFTVATPGEYCEDPITPAEGSNVALKLNRYGNRDYSIRLSATCTNPTPPPTVAPPPKKDCKECWCVEGKRGKEVSGSRKEGDVAC